MARGEKSFIKAEIGLLASQFGACYPLQACPECIVFDAKEHGTMYWHVRHQLPGISICLTHQCRLLTCTYKVSGQNRFHWLLPSQARLQPGPSGRVISESALAYAEMAVGLLNLPVDFSFDQNRLHQLYLRQASSHGLLNPRGYLIRAEIEKLLEAVFVSANFADAFPSLALESTRTTLVGRIIRLLHKESPRHSRHPLNHALIWLMFFDSWESFWTAYCAPVDLIDPTSSTSTSVITQPEAVAPDHRRAELLRLIDSGMSISAAAKSLGIAVATGQAWSASAGKASSRRPKLLKTDVLDEAIRRLRRGENKSAVSKAIGTSQVTVTRLLFTEPGLHDAWQSSRFSRLQMRTRSQWNKVISSFPDASSTVWRRLQPAIYAWLYRNDREWLQDSIQKRKLPVQSSPWRRDWASRDQRLAQSVKNQALNWHVENAGKRLSLGILCSLIPSLKPLMGDLTKLPTTRDAIMDAVSRSRTVMSSPQAQLASLK